MRCSHALAVLLVVPSLGCWGGSPPPATSTAAPPRPAGVVEETGGSATSGEAVTPGGGDRPLPLPSARPQGLAAVAPVKGFVPGGGDGGPTMAEADKLFSQQNWKDAAAAYGKALAAGMGRDAAWKASTQIVLCQLRLSAWDDAILAARDTVGRFLGTLDEARAYRILGNLYLTLPHQGTEAGGKFQRGTYGQGIYRMSYRMDRRLAVAALERSRDLYAAFAEGKRQAEGVAAADVDRERVETLFDLVTAVVSYGPYDSTWSYPWWGWLEVEEGDGTVDEELAAGGGFHRGRHLEEDMADPGEAGWPTGLPVAADGTPVFDPTPAAYDPALPPGQKMKFLLGEIEKLDPTEARDYAARARLRRATLAKNRYGPERLNQWVGFWIGGKQPLAEQAKAKPLHELEDSEAFTLLGRRLAVVKLPPDEDVLGLLAGIEKEFPKATLSAEGLYAAGVYHQRRGQHGKAIAAYEAIGQRFPAHARAAAGLAQIKAIRAAEAVLEPVGVQLAGSAVVVKASHRNITTIHLSARRLDLKKWLDDLWAEIATDDERKWSWRDPANLSYDLIQRNDSGGRPVYERYAQGDPIRWEAAVKDDGTHRYRQEDLPVPAAVAAAPGCFVVEIDAADAMGTASRNILLVSDLALVEKRYKGGHLYLLASARDGAPVAGAPLRLLTYWQEWKQEGSGQGKNIFHHEEIGKTTDGDGLALVSLPQGTYRQSIAMAALPDGRLAFSGLRHLSHYYASQRQSGVRTLVFTDRPVYRPGQKVQVKVWMRQLVDGEYREPVAQKDVAWSVTDARNGKLADGHIDIDDMGGGTFSVELPDEPPLGLYRIDIGGTSYYGGNQFRVEEYRKPEFEVAVESAAAEARLGEKVAATIKATYLFGAPVADARVTWRIYREDHALRYAAPGPWDWLYGPGYGLCPYEYGFYPFWAYWGCKRAWPWVPWKPARELVGEGEGRLGAEGTVAFTIDTTPAQRDFPDRDHRYTVVAEVTDASRRTITGEGEVVVTRNAFEAFVDPDRGYYRPGDEIMVEVRTLTPTGTPVAAKGKLTFARVRAQAAEGDGGIAAATEAPEKIADLETDGEGRARMTLRAGASGQFVVRYETKDGKGRAITGSALMWVCGADFDGGLYRMNDLEILTDKRTYAPGETARVLVQSRHRGARVLLATRADQGTLLEYRMVRMSGKSTVVDVPVGKGDVPNFFLEGTTIFDGDVHQEVREVLVPPQGSMLEVSVVADRLEVAAGGACKLRVSTKTPDGKPVRAQVALSVFDKAVLQIQPEITPSIRKFLWGDRRHHQPQGDSNLRWQMQPYSVRHDPQQALAGPWPEDWDGGFGNRWLSLESADEKSVLRQLGYVGAAGGKGNAQEVGGMAAPESPAPAKSAADALATSKEEASGSRERRAEAKKQKADREDDASGGEGEGGPLKAATVRKTFADTALWLAAIDTTDAGEATIEVPFPQNLTTWRIKALGLTRHSRAGDGTAQVIATKDFLVRLAAPRFFTERDVVVLSANVHNDLPRPKSAKVTLKVPPELLALTTPATATVTVPAHGQARVDWTVEAKREGMATIGVEALTDEESDATEMAFPVLVHGFTKTVSATGLVRPDGPGVSEARFEVPAERRPEESVLAVRISPSLGLAMLDALPYLIEYPYGCTEQTMSRFVPAVMTLKTLQKMGVRLEDLEKARTNLNAQQVGPQRFDLPPDPNRPPVYSKSELEKVIREGLKRIADMQRPDGGWGWWANDSPSTYLTTYVVWGLLEAREDDVAVDGGMLSRGLQALQGSVRKDLDDWKEWDWIGNEQAFVAYALSRARKGEVDEKLLLEVLELCFTQRIHLSLQGKALLSLALRNAGDAARADLVLQNARQKEKVDAENQTVFYATDTERWWWWWHNDIESMAWMLRAIVAKDPKDPAAPGLVKWLLNNRRHGTYWRSTRDTALAVAAFSDYLELSGEAEPDMTVRVLLDGKPLGERRITKENVFTFDNAFVLSGKDLATGSHTLRVERQGKGPVYWNAELAYFTMEEGAKAAGLEIKVTRRYFKLEREDAKGVIPGDRLQPVASQRVRYRRVELKDGDAVTSGDLLEVELKLTSKNDYDYLVFEDPKPAGCEPVEVRSGARWGELCSNMELRDEKVAFFVSWLAKGDHLIRYRLRAEAPGTFHTMPTRGWAMYAPELRANADELVFSVKDRAP